MVTNCRLQTVRWLFENTFGQITDLKSVTNNDYWRGGLLPMAVMALFIVNIFILLGVFIRPDSYQDMSQILLSLASL